MDFIKKNLWLFIAGGLALALLLAAVVFLYWQVSGFRGVNTALSEEQDRLQELHRQSPYPNEANVQVVQSNLFLLTRYERQLTDQLRQGQIEERKMQPVDFNYYLQTTIPKMFAQAEQQKIGLPAKFAFGFDTYYHAGRLPALADVPRLTVQFQMIEALFHLLSAARISEIVSLERTRFDQITAPGGEPAGVGRLQHAPPAEETAALKAKYAIEPPEAGGLYTREHFSLTVAGSDEIIMGLLNALARSGAAATNQQKIFAVVSRLSLTSYEPGEKKTADGRRPAGGVRRPASRAAPPEPEAENPAPGGKVVPREDPRPQEERVIAGREVVEAQMELDLFRLTGKAQEPAAP